MTKIDGIWINSRLTGVRGEKARLAEAMGIHPNVLSKILSGVRSVNQGEAMAAEAYFSPPDQTDPLAQSILDRIQLLSPDGREQASTLVDVLLSREAARQG